jgi:peroxiredoxin
MKPLAVVVGWRAAANNCLPLKTQNGEKKVNVLAHERMSVSMSTNEQRTWGSRFLKAEWFLLILLAGSLTLNVYQGWKLKGKTESPPAPPVTQKLSAGMSIPVLNVTSSAGVPDAISYSNTKPTVLYVFSPSCDWCQRNNANVNAIATLKNDSYTFVGLSLSDYQLRKYVETEHIPFPVYSGLTGELIEKLGFTETPQLLVISSDGIVLKSWTGAFVKEVAQDVEGYFNIRLPGVTVKR